MNSVLVSLTSGPGVVRSPNGLLVTDDVERGGGAFLRSDDRFAPERAWGAGWQRRAVGGLLPPGATRVEAFDDSGQAHEAAVGQGAYIAEVGAASQMLAPVVCCRDERGWPVRRPRGGDYPCVRVTDSQEPCPACGAVDWDEYTPTEPWRGGGSASNGSRIPSPIVCCRVCGHEEPEGVFFGRRAEPNEDEDEATRAVRVAAARARARRQRWLSDTMTLRAAGFAIYVADGFPARVGGSGLRDEVQTEVTIYQYESITTEDPQLEQKPSLSITTALTERLHRDGPAELRDALEQWVDRQRGPQDWPEASYAAITLWLRARQRERRAYVLTATQARSELTLDGVLVKAKRLTTENGLWVASVDRDDFTLVICARDTDPATLRLEPFGNPARVLGLEPPDA
jgi:hypothetical protein